MKLSSNRWRCQSHPSCCRSAEWSGSSGCINPRINLHGMAERDLVAREDIDDENWDEEEMRDVEWKPREIPMFQPQEAAVREVAVALPRASRNVCFNCSQPDHFSGQCPRPRVRIYCRNCDRLGEDLNSCPRCGEAHAEVLRRNFGGEGRYEQELERRGRVALCFEQQRAEEMRRRQFIAEQEWRARMEAGARAQQASLQNSVAGVPPRQAQLRGDARAVPAPTLYAAAELVGGLQAMPVEGQEIVIRAMHESLNRR